MVIIHTKSPHMQLVSYVQTVYFRPFALISGLMSISFTVLFTIDPCNIFSLHSG